MRLRLSLALASLAIVACDTSTSTDPSRLVPSAPSLAQDRLPAGTAIQVAFITAVEPGTTFFVKESTDGSAYCMNEAAGIGPHYVTSVSYMGGSSDPRMLRDLTETWASPNLPRGTRFRVTGAWGAPGLYTCGAGFYLYDAVVIQ